MSGYTTSTNSTGRQGNPPGEAGRAEQARWQGRDSFEVHPQILGEAAAPRKIPGGETHRPDQS